MGKILGNIGGRLAKCLAVMALVVAPFSAVLLPATAEAVSCHVFSSSRAGATDGYFYTPIYTVPSSSGCADINIGAIGTSNHCAYMKVEFFPSSGGSYFGSEKYLCSSSISDHKVIAWTVNNGTRYRIWAAYPTNALGITYAFKIID